MRAPELQLHQGGPVLTAGEPLASARAAMILVHGRGASAADILSLAREIDAPRVAYIAPQATGNVWYPQSFLAPIEANEPWLSSALARVDEVAEEVLSAGFAAQQIYLLGFSQGASLALEYAARHPRSYGGVVGLSGGLIGPPGGLRPYDGSLAGVPLFLGCSDVDPYIPVGRVEESGEIFRQLGAAVTLRLYPHGGHTVNQDELAWVRTLLG